MSEEDDVVWMARQIDIAALRQAKSPLLYAAMSGDISPSECGLSIAKLLNDPSGPVATLRAEVADWKGRYGTMEGFWRDAKARIEATEQREERLSAEVARLQGERDRQYEENVNRIAKEGAAILRAEVAEAEVARLREALEPIANLFVGDLGDTGFVRGLMAKDVRMARTALNPPSEPPATPGDDP